jgi:hypothetical protein
MLLVGIVTVSLVATAHGFSVGSGNGAFYFVGGPPNVNHTARSFGTPHAGGSVNQHAAAYTPGGIGMVSQYASASGGQASGPHFQGQGFSVGMFQSAFKMGGSGAVGGTQVGHVHMTQTNPAGTAIQSARATGMQSTMIFGGPGGMAAASQSMHVSTAQLKVY